MDLHRSTKEGGRMHKNLSLTGSLLVIRLLSLLYFIPLHDLEVISQGSVTDRIPKLNNCSQLCRTSLPQYPPSVERSLHTTLGASQSHCSQSIKRQLLLLCPSKSSNYAVLGVLVSGQVLPACSETQKMETETPKLAAISCYFLYNSLHQSSAASEAKMVSLLIVTDGFFVLKNWPSIFELKLFVPTTEEELVTKLSKV